MSGPLRGRTPLSFLRELPVLIVVAFLLAVVMKAFLIQAFFIPSESMEPTLCGSSTCHARVLVNKLAYHFRDPTRGDVVVFIHVHAVVDHSFFGRIKHFVGEGIGLFNATDTDYIKRVIGLPGDTVQVTDAGVYVTPAGGQRFKLREPYIFSAQQQGPAWGPKEVPAGQYFVLGDNRANSEDSRFIGFIKREDIIGRAFVKIWPVTKAGRLPIPCYPQRTPLVRCPPVKAAPAQSMPLLPVGLPLFAGIGAVEFRRHERRRRTRRAVRVERRRSRT